jgi:hypothetical protein
MNPPTWAVYDTALFLDWKKRKASAPMMINMVNNRLQWFKIPLISLSQLMINFIVCDDQRGKVTKKKEKKKKEKKALFYNHLSKMNAEYSIYTCGATHQSIPGTISHYKAQRTTKNAQLVDETKAQRSMNHVDGNSKQQLHEHIG